VTDAELRDVGERVTRLLLEHRGGRQVGDEVTFRCFHPELHRNGDAHHSARWNVVKLCWCCPVCGKRGSALNARWLLFQATSHASPPRAKRVGRRDEGTQRETGRWPIRDAAGTVVAVHVRREPGRGGTPKECIWQGPEGQPGLGGRKVETLPLYGVHELASVPPGSPVVLVEGQKARDALTARGIVAVATVTGASTIPTDDVLRALAGYDVVPWTDADPPGRRHMQRIADRLTVLGIAHRNRTVDPWPEHSDGRDAADWTGTDEELLELLGTASRDQAEGPAPGDRSSRSFSSSHKTAPWPAPLAPEALHGLTGEIVRTIGPETEADDVALLLQFLVVFGNVVSRSAYLSVEADRHYTNLFAVLVGQTSKGRKGTSWGHVKRLFMLADEDWASTRIEGGLSSGEGLIWAVRDPARKMDKVSGGKGEEPRYVEVVADHGVSDKRLLVFEPEFGTTLRMLERQGNTLSGVVRQAWDTGRLNTLVKHAAASATDAHISIVGHSTRQELLRYLSRTELGNGFANRFLFACIQRSKCLPRGGHLSDATVRHLAEELTRVIASARRVTQLTVSEGAWRIWEQVYETRPCLSPGRDC
jgi:hypothetical protein